jgi:hypothetical protein
MISSTVHPKASILTKARRLPAAQRLSELQHGQVVVDDDTLELIRLVQMLGAPHQIDGMGHAVDGADPQEGGVRHDNLEEALWGAGKSPSAKVMTCAGFLPRAPSRKGSGISISCSTTEKTTALGRNPKTRATASASPAISSFSRNISRFIADRLPGVGFTQLTFARCSIHGGRAASQ